MIGFIFLIAVFVYLALLIWFTRLAYRWAKAKDLSKCKCWLAAAGGFLAVWLPVFWDFIPTQAANKYYCATQAGFTVHKTVERWVAENSDAAKTLTKKERLVDSKLPDGTIRIELNERFVSDIRRENPVFLLSTHITREEITDSKKGEVLARHVSVGSGYGNPFVGGGDWRGFKFWLNARCVPPLSEFVKFQNAVKNLGGE